MQGYLAYVDFLLGIGLTLGFFWLVTGELWHRFMHTNREGCFLNGRLICRHCANEKADITRDQWRDEVLDRVRKVL
jgi:hypothetical protein